MSKVEKSVKTESLQDRAIKTKMRIVKEAENSFSEHGYSASNIRSIAEAAGVKHSIIKYHFGSKKALWIMVVEQLFEQLLKVGENFTFDKQNDPIEQFKQQTYTMVEYVAKHPQLFRILIIESITEKSMLDNVRPQVEQFTNISMQYYQQLQGFGICSNISLEDFHSIFNSTIFIRFIYDYETRIIKGTALDDPKNIRSYVDSLTKVILGHASS